MSQVAVEMNVPCKIVLAGVDTGDQYTLLMW